jgi:hypothetical protein
VNNSRQQVKPEDVIEIALGTYERALATQTSTNPTYSVTPPDFVRSWIKTNAMALNGTAYKVCYTSYWPSTTGVGAVQSYTSNVQPSINYAASWTATNGWVWTNVNVWPSITVTDSYETVTNAIGWHLDRDMMVSLDTTIKALVPYYVDTNTVYDGTTNIVMLTVTGLWDQLKIGDGGIHITTNTNTMVVSTNWGLSFTRTPCWTNPVSTNWIVNYTSYWPSTNGVATNICYTSDYRQVVNYAQSWTATGGHVWVTSSNWASLVVTVTNATTYGDYPWQIYPEDLQERYKVLNALRMTAVPYFTTNTETRAIKAKSGRKHYYYNWNDLVTKVSECWVSGVNTSTVLPYSDIRINEGGSGNLSYYSAGSGVTTYGVTNIGYHTIWNLQLYGASVRFYSTVYCADELGLDGNLEIYISKTNIFEPYGGYEVSSNWNNNGIAISEPSGWQILETVPFTNSGVITGAFWGYPDMPNHIPVICSQPTESDVSTPLDGGDYMMYGNSEGFNLQIKGQGLIDWQFNYCTNKYW